AILTLCFPKYYAVIDVRNWRQIMDKKPITTYSIKDYIEYLRKIKRLANKFEVTPQEIDLAIWQFDKENGPSV
ncbi:MAG: hypothetical protein ACHQD8_06685, partial [Chitinophagales bacterium]